MAIKSLLKQTKPKATHKRDPLFLDEKYTGGEPVWDHARALKFTDEEFDSNLRASWAYYNYFFTLKDMKKYVIAWAQEHMKLTKEQLSTYIAANAELTPMTVSGMIRAVGKGMPLKPKHKAYIVKTIKDIIANAGTTAESSVTLKAVKPVKSPSAVVLTIQDRLAKKTSEVIGEIEGEVDNVFMNKKSTFVLYDFLTAKSVPQAQIGKIRTVFQKQIDELTIAFSGKDEYLAEAYSHLGKADIKRIGDFYVKLLADLDSYTSVKRATKKARVKKPVAASKVVAKLKYMKENKELKLVSISPVDIIGATELWTYDTKYRKLYRYVADAHIGTLGVKGTSILGYDENKSVGKTLRKPDEQLKALMKIGKVQLRTYLTNIKAVEVKANGRISDRHLLLKVA